MEKKNKRRRWLWIIPIVVILIIVASTLGKKRTGGFEINSMPVAEEQAAS